MMNWSTIIIFVVVIYMAVGILFTWVLRKKLFEDLPRTKFPKVLKLILFLIHAVLGPVMWVLFKNFLVVEEGKPLRLRKIPRWVIGIPGGLKEYRRNKKRVIWTKSHSPIICYSIHSGIYAFVRGEDLERESARHQRYIEQGVAEHAKYLLSLLPDTVVFVTKPAEDRIADWKYVSGGLASINDLFENPDIILERNDDIFVPFVNAAILPYDEQGKRMREKLPNGQVRISGGHSKAFLTEVELPVALQ